MIEVIDDLIPPMYQQELLGLVKELNYHFCPTTSQNTIVDNNTVDYGQFVNSCYVKDTRQQDASFPWIFPILYFLNQKTGTNVGTVSRIKTNLLTCIPSFKPSDYNMAHTDFKEPRKVLLYYVNDSDGDTVLFDQFADQEFSNLTVSQRITPKQGRGVLFDANRYHASSNPAISPFRYAINFNFE